MSTPPETGMNERESLLTRPFLIVTGSALFFFVYIGMLIPIVPLFIEGPLEAGEFGIGVTIAVFALAAIAARPFLGRLADRFGRRVLMVAGAVMAGLSGIASSQVSEFWQLLVLRGLTGIGEAAVFVGAATLIADMSPRARRAEGASYFSVAVFGGIGLGPIIGEAMLDDVNFERGFFVAGLLAFVSAGLALFAPARVEPLDAVDDTIASAAPATGRRRLIHPAAIMPGLVLAAGVAAFASFGAFIPDYSRSVGLASSGGLFAVYALVSILVRVFGATLPERLGPRRAVSIALSNVLIGLAILAAFPTIPALWIASVFVGIGMAFNYPSLLALTVNRASDSDRAWAVSSFTMFFEVGSVAGGLLIGAFAEVVGKQLGFLGGVMFCALGLYLLRFRLVPVGSPDAGPARRAPTAAYTPVAGD
ncbi:MAG TPA: MFS transporter [Ilumatobacteraceae bacterium]|nr:MFS transporter [Ilumatobacteraceae bacterium]